ncbi:MAG: DUF58 domain-containing protein [Spongiibacteraceae bacterium]
MSESAVITSGNSALSTEARGVQVSQQQLIQLRFAAHRLTQANGKRTSQRVGSHSSPLKGRGLAFHHVREYQGGDEIRHIDWRVTARTAKAHSKIFEEEKERPVVLCVDQRQSMFFGTQQCFKSVLACHAAAVLAWSGLKNSDRIGGLVFNDNGHREIRPRHSHRAVLHFLHTISEYNQLLTEQPVAPVGQRQSLATAFEELRRITKPGSTVFVISDFIGYDTAAMRQLHLIGRHNDVVAISLHDPLDGSLPDTGHYAFSDGQQQLRLNINKALIQKYQSHREQQYQAMLHSFKRSRIHHIPLTTSGNYFVSLQQGLGLS